MPELKSKAKKLRRGLENFLSVGAGVFGLSQVTGLKPGARTIFAGIADFELDRR
jgi:hypothetical protein